MTPANYISIAALIVSLVMTAFNIRNGNNNNRRADAAQDEAN